MKNTETSFFKMIEEICAEENIFLECFSFGYVFKLTKDNKTKYIIGKRFGINNAAASDICKDKAATSEILEKAMIPCILHELFLCPEESFYIGMDDVIHQINKYFERFKKIVIKPNIGQGGLDVYLIEDKDKLLKKVDYLFNKYRSLAISPYYDIKMEYRIIVLDGVIKLVYGKKRTDDWRFNLENGAVAITDIDETLKIKLEELALRAAKVLDMRFVTVDIVDTKEGLKVIELNCGVTTEKFVEQDKKRYPKVKEIYREVILKMF